MTGIPDSSLFDIKPATADVTAGGIRHKVIGVPFGTFLRIGMIWPKFFGLLAGKPIDQAEFAEAPEAISEFIAAGFNLSGNTDAIAKAGSLPLDVQMDLFTAIMKQTLGGGAGPFAKKAEAISEVMSGASSSRPPDESPLNSAVNGGSLTLSTTGPKPSSLSSPTAS